MVHLLEERADRWRVVVDVTPRDRRLFEAFVPKDATAAELEAFFDELTKILRKRRASDLEAKVVPTKP